MDLSVAFLQLKWVSHSRSEPRHGPKIRISKDKLASQIHVSIEILEILASKAHGLSVLVTSVSSKAHSPTVMTKLEFEFALAICKSVDARAPKILFGMDIAFANDLASFYTGDFRDFLNHKR